MEKDGEREGKKKYSQRKKYRDQIEKRGNDSRKKL